MIALWAVLISGAFGFLAVMLGAVATGQDKVAGSHLRLLQWHHEYAGWALFVLAGLASWVWLVLALRVIALALVWDDTVQHAVQLATGDLAWRSPLHRVYARATARWSWLRRIEEWLDGK